MKRAPIDIISEFFEAWAAGPEVLERALRALFRPDTEWLNMGLSRAVGPDEALDLGRAFEARIGYRQILVETLHAAANGNVVFTERLDRLIGADGQELGAFLIAGVFELDEEGKLLRWRDYTDPDGLKALHALEAAA
jgi:limonene-1,2-epoxide hydrolase